MLLDVVLGLRIGVAFPVAVGTVIAVEVQLPVTEGVDQRHRHETDRYAASNDERIALEIPLDPVLGVVEERHILARERIEYRRVALRRDQVALGDWRLYEPDVSGSWVKDDLVIRRQTALSEPVRRAIERENRLPVLLPAEYLAQIVEERWAAPNQDRVTVVGRDFLTHPRDIALAVEVDVVKPLFGGRVGERDPLVRLTDAKPFRAVVLHPRLARASEVENVAAPAIVARMVRRQIVGIDRHKPDNGAGTGGDARMQRGADNSGQRPLIVAPVVVHPLKSPFPNIRDRSAPARKDGSRVEDAVREWPRCKGNRERLLKHFLGIAREHAIGPDENAIVFGER